MSKTVLLDTNIYDSLQADVGTRDLLTRLVGEGRVSIIVTPKVRDELAAGPFGGVPAWIPMHHVIESVAVLGHWHLGEAALGEGQVFTAHRGESNKVGDAIIADSADTYADILVSEDARLRKHFTSVSERCLALDFGEFRAWLKSQV
jgi:hypothetical protein